MIFRKSIGFKTMEIQMKELYTIRTKSQFESAHAIRQYIEDPNKPGSFLDEDIHGHTFIVEAFASSNYIEQRTGFALDFMVLKQKVEQLANHFDHRFINEVPPFDKINPSTENLAKYFFVEINKIIPSGSWLKKVRIYEGPNNFAEYSVRD